MAATIWSGVGEVNTWPGQAASSIPRPTKPACRGSWPEPPPEINATLPGVNLRRRTNFRSAPSSTMSACAAAKPSRLSSSMVSTAFISLFIPSSSLFARRSKAPPSILHRRHEANEVAHIFRDHCVDSLVSPGAPQIGHGEADRPNSHCRLAGLAPTGVRSVIGGEKGRSVGRRKVADLENGLQMLGRDRHRIDRIDQLRHERAVRTERDGKPPPRPGGPVVAHRLQEPLVVSDGCAGGSVVHGSASRRSIAAIACLAAPTEAGATDSERRPALSNAPITLGSPPASPQRLTSRPFARPYRATEAISRSTAGFRGSASSATAPMSRPAAVTYCVKSFEPIEKKSASNLSMTMAAAGTSIMMPSLG